MGRDSLPLLADVLTGKKLFTEFRTEEKLTVIQSAFDSGVADNLYHHIRVNELDPEDIPNFEELEQVAQARYSQYLRRVNQIKMIAQRFEKAAIPLVFFKGFSVCHQVYSAPYLRSMDDVDFLIPKPYARDGISLLKEEGFVLKLPRLGYEHPLTWKYEHVFELYQNDLFVDLHTHLHDVRGIMQLSADQYAWLLEQSIPVALAADFQIYGMRPEIELLYVGVHALMHHFREPSFRNYLDIYSLSQVPSLDWDFVVDTAAKFGWEKALFVMLKQVSQIFGEQSLKSVPAEIIAAIHGASLNEYLTAVRKEFTFWRVVQNVEPKDRFNFFFHLYILPSRQYFREWYGIQKFWELPKAILQFWLDRLSTFKRIRFDGKKH